MAAVMLLGVCLGVDTINGSIVATKWHACAWVLWVALGLPVCLDSNPLLSTSLSAQGNIHLVLVTSTGGFKLVGESSP